MGRHHRLPRRRYHRRGSRRRRPRRHLHSLWRATDSHQLRNAQEMASAGAGRVITEAELTGERLSKEIFALLDSPQEIERMSVAARSLAWPNAARDIVNLIEQAAGITPSPEKVRAAAGSSTVSTSGISTPDREKVAP